MAKKSTKRSKKPDETKEQTPEQRLEHVVPDRHEPAPIPTDAPGSGLTSLSDYYQEPDPEPTITPQERAIIRDEALMATFGVPVPDFRSAVVARLNNKLKD